MLHFVILLYLTSVLFADSPLANVVLQRINCEGRSEWQFPIIEKYHENTNLDSYFLGDFLAALLPTDMSTMSPVRWIQHLLADFLTLCLSKGVYEDNSARLKQDQEDIKSSKNIEANIGQHVTRCSVVMKTLASLLSSLTGKQILDCEIVDLAGTLAAVELTYPNSTQLMVNSAQYCRLSRIGADDSPAFRSIAWLLEEISKESIMEIAKNLGAGAHYGCLGAKYKFDNLAVQPNHAHYNLLCLYRKPTGKEKC